MTFGSVFGAIEGGVGGEESLPVQDAPSTDDSETQPVVLLQFIITCKIFVLSFSHQCPI